MIVCRNKYIKDIMKMQMFLIETCKSMLQR
jgi:hypothetical protein